MLKQAFGDEAVSRTQTHEWYKCCKEEWASVEDIEHSGKPSASKNEENNQRVLKVIHSNCHMTIHEVMGFSLKIWAGFTLQPNLCRSCCLKIGNKIMFLSVKSLLTVQMLSKTY